MGEMSYITNNEKYIRFDTESDYGCLCTFPHNNEVGGKKLSAGKIASLALLGAAVAIAANKPQSMDNANSYGEYYYLPNCIPQWIRDEIDRILKL